MSLPEVNRLSVRKKHPLVTEFALVIVVAFVFLYFQQAFLAGASLLRDALPLPDGMLTDGLVIGGALLGGAVLFGGAYATLRDVDVGLALPTREDWPLAGTALLLPVLLVGLTKLVGVLTGTLYGSLTMTTYRIAMLEPFLYTIGLRLVVGVPSCLLLCQVVVQRGFDRVVGGGAAVGLTTVLGGFLLANSSGGLSSVPDQGRLFGAMLFCLAVAWGLYVNNHVEREWVRYASYLPASLFVVAVAISRVAAVETVAGVLFVGTQLTVLGLAAYTYERTDSLLVPGLAYFSLFLANEVVVFGLEAGLAPA